MTAIPRIGDKMILAIVPHKYGILTMYISRTLKEAQDKLGRLKEGSLIRRGKINPMYQHVKFIAVKRTIIKGIES